jgi:hypothetical protein
MNTVAGEEDLHLVSLLDRGARDQERERRARRIFGSGRRVNQDSRHVPLPSVS